ncbi:alpha/beta-hydrolase [Patellaria atrata CBS 101060]|uniref:Alpha/beta-hydrolase n=1 Tax=Patellaria atrata CBS 101060 TaxID=1346257 RepID=A0A9P4S9B1_9PEZI|nr:alpha/beta-hydrolase [Patellaria atrata CBS 101060]
MPLNTISVSAAVTPTVIETCFKHYLNRKQLAQKPTARISYHEGLQLIRQFLHYASFHTVEELQAFTAQWVPVPRWVKVEEIEVSQKRLECAAAHIQKQLGPKGVEKVGGKNWWQWRRDNAPLKAEWIEMRKDYSERKRTGEKGQRIMMYIHGGAYYFGSVDEHRYQVQRHARKLKARVLAPRYRLAPQFPFPCGLQDCLATYLHLLETHHPSTILLAGDSAGGGMALSLLVILRDQGVPLPAGVILLSPWVDLTHSFPSLGGDGKLDYIPSHGFVHKPSMAWPPPNDDEMEELYKGLLDNTSQVNGVKSPQLKAEAKKVEKDKVRGYSVSHERDDPETTLRKIDPDKSPKAGPHLDLTITIDGKLVKLKDQIQLYARNSLTNHPLVSPVLQTTLGGLPPVLIQVGGGELLRDEQIYLAHKLANPLKYKPSPTFLAEYDPDGTLLWKYKSTDVQLQVWDDLCHVAPTLSFTRPAKYMYRSIAQFGAWALARAQKTSIDILDDDDISVISSASSVKSSTEDLKKATDGSDTVRGRSTTVAVGKAGDSLPPFQKHMIRQRVDRNGNIHPLEPASELPALNVPPEEIGVIKEGPVRKWMTAQAKWNGKYAKQKRAVQRKRLSEMQKGYEGFGEGAEREIPPPTALAGRRLKDMPKQKKNTRSWGMSLWSVWGSKHDEVTIEREEKADQTETATDSKETDGAITDTLTSPTSSYAQSRSRSRRRPIKDEGQAASHSQVNLPTLTQPNLQKDDARGLPGSGTDTPTTAGRTIIPKTDTATTRPTKGGIAYPFKLSVPGQDKDVNASMLTLMSIQGPGTPGFEERKELEEVEKKGAEGERVMGKEESGVATSGLDSKGEKDMEEAVPKRPEPERFITAPEF